ncbi:MAG: bifunctional class I SAM-dependent methyltransferase/glycosyltransferase family 2 protein [Bacteroidota bacterium]|nr:bifunctional class I SAM-dependent methyltransferase/glycosyltransferase family 2 protein [Bacteroidota bacterium]
MKKENLISFFDSYADRWDQWKNRNRYYYKDIEKLLRFVIVPNSSVIEIGCGTGDFINAVQPSYGVGIDFSSKMVDHAQKKYPHLKFFTMDAEDFSLDEIFDYVIMSDLVGHLNDIQKAFDAAQKIMKPHSRFVITYHNFMWEPVFWLASKLGLKVTVNPQNWINSNDLQNLLELSGFEIVRTGQQLILPKNIPVLSWFVNKYFTQLPLFKHLSVTRYIIARPKVVVPAEKKYSVSVIIPARNEKGNIERALQTVPSMGSHTEIIFVEGHSTDGTFEEIKRVVSENKRSDISVKYSVQKGKGKGDAVREGFSLASGEILMILDADLTVAPSELPKFYNAIASNHGEFINGSRMVYPMEKEAMRFLNMLGNKFFSMLFTWLLGQIFKDTLCGTKVLYKKDYERIAANRHYFGEFDPFGDFDLIFGASKLQLKIAEIPIRYRERTYGDTNISRFRHGLLLLRMSWFAMNKLKFR